MVYAVCMNALEEKDGRFQLGGVRYTYRAMLLPEIPGEHPKRWQINVHELGGVMPATFKVAPTFQDAIMAAKDALR